MKRRLVVFASISAVLVAATFAWLASLDGRPVSRVVWAGAVGAFCGVVLSGMVALAVWFVGRWRAGPPALGLLPGEEPLREVRANHLTDKESRGGRLLVTNRRIVFRPHRFNSDLGAVALAHADIDEVRVATEQLALAARGEVHQFVVTLSSDAELEALGAQIASMVKASRGG